MSEVLEMTVPHCDHTALRGEALPKTVRRTHTRASTHDRPDDRAPFHGAHQSDERPRGSGSRDLAGLKIVVVDDDPDTLDFFAFALRSCGALVSTADNAQEGLRLVHEARPHVVLSDIAMVGQDGYWLVRTIRELPDDAARLVPVVATTAYGREHSRERVLRAGFTEHLPKPVDPDVLCHTLGKAAGRP